MYICSYIYIYISIYTHTHNHTQKVPARSHWAFFSVSWYRKTLFQNCVFHLPYLSTLPFYCTDTCVWMMRRVVHTSGELRHKGACLHSTLCARPRFCSCYTVNLHASCDTYEWVMAHIWMHGIRHTSMGTCLHSTVCVRPR